MILACALNVFSNKFISILPEYSKSWHWTRRSFIKFCYLRVDEVRLVALWRQERLVHARNHENSFQHFQFYVKSSGTRKSLGRIRRASGKSCTNSPVIDWAFLMQMSSTTCRFRGRNEFIHLIATGCVCCQRHFTKKLSVDKSKVGRIQMQKWPTRASLFPMVIQLNWKVTKLNWNLLIFDLP